MKVLDFSKPVHNLMGDLDKDSSSERLFSEFLLLLKGSANPVRMADVAFEARKTKKVTIDQETFDEIKSFIVDDRQILTNLHKYELLKVMNAAKDKS